MSKLNNLMNLVTKDGPKKKYVRAWWGDREQGIHRALAEMALKKKLPRGSVVHHVDGDIHNNHRSNLVVCPDTAYHALLHRRTELLFPGLLKEGRRRLSGRRP